MLGEIKDFIFHDYNGLHFSSTVREAIQEKSELVVEFFEAHFCASTFMEFLMKIEGFGCFGHFS